MPGDGSKPPYGEGFYLRPVGARSWGREGPHFPLSEPHVGVAQDTPDLDQFII